MKILESYKSKLVVEFSPKDIDNLNTLMVTLGDLDFSGRDDEGSLEQTYSIFNDMLQEYVDTNDSGEII